jgi:hypothetical protein
MPHSNLKRINSDILQTCHRLQEPGNRHREFVLKQLIENLKRYSNDNGDEWAKVFWVSDCVDFLAYVRESFPRKVISWRVSEYNYAVATLAASEVPNDLREELASWVLKPLDTKDILEIAEFKQDHGMEGLTQDQT